MAAITWNREIAEVYDVTSAAMFEPEVLNPVVDRLAELARSGSVLEFAVGTGRVALPLSARGIEVWGIELSPHMAEMMRRKPGAEGVPVTIGDMVSARVDRDFSLVYLVWNTIMNLTTQKEQVAVFANAARHLEPGGCFLIEVAIPQLRKVPPGEAGRIFTFKDDHIGIETFDDLLGQVTWSHHWMEVEGQLIRQSAPYRYVWPAELDLMAQLSGMALKDRWGGWRNEPLTNASTSHVSVWQKPGG